MTRFVPIMLTIFLLLLTCAVVFGAEVRNLKVGQSGDRGFASFDLTGKVGEREAEVLVTLTINGEKYSADKLTLTGDYGKKVRVGVGKKIFWEILADIPAGYDGEVIWNVDTTLSLTSPPQHEKITAAAAPASLERHPFQFSEKVAKDKRTGLIWMREISKGGKAAASFTVRSYITGLQNSGFADCKNWNLPSAAQMKKIISYATAAGYTGKNSKGYPADFFNAIGFKSVANDYYLIGIIPPSGWSQNTVDLEDGNTMLRDNKDYLQYWPVCNPMTTQED